MMTGPIRIRDNIGRLCGLYHKDGRPVQYGERVVDFRGDLDRIVGGRPPHRPGTTGHIYTRMPDVAQASEFYPGVFDLEWRVEVDD